MCRRSAVGFAAAVRVEDRLGPADLAGAVESRFLAGV
jgi:hypothetical protein